MGNSSTEAVPSLDDLPELSGDVTDLAAHAGKRAFGNTEWQKVRAAKPWHPVPGDELVGRFIGRQVRNGSFGRYEQFHIYVPVLGAFYLAGSCIARLANACALERGMPVRVVYTGEKDIGGGRSMKEYELYVPKESK